MTDETKATVPTEDKVEEPVVTEEIKVSEPIIADDWRSGLSDELKDSDMIKEVKSVEDLAKGYVHAQKSIGGMVRIPGEDAGAEQLDAFYSRLETIPGVTRINSEDMAGLYDKLGRPESAEKYEIKLDIDPEIWDNTQVEKFKTVAYELGLNHSQLNKLLEFEKIRIDEHAEAVQDVRVSSERALRDTWGEAYDSRLAGAKAAIAVFADKFPEDVKALVAGPAGNNPAFLAILAEIGGNMQESGHPGLKTVSRYGVTPEEAQEQINEIKGNLAHAYYNATDPEHPAAVLKVQKLYNSVHPDSETVTHRGRDPIY